jgi:hypothetical protein
LETPELDPEQFSVYRHEAVHELMRLNELCVKEFRISSWPRWDYDLERGTLTFSENGVPKVVALIQVVGTTSVAHRTWMWGWANESLPANATKSVTTVREFGHTQRIAELTETTLPDDEYLGWGMTAVAAKVLGAKGAYRCPDKDGFMYLVYSSIRLATDSDDTAAEPRQVECDQHETGFATYVCEHLASSPAQEWFSQEPDEENRWPDAWCADCEALFQEQGEWNDENEPKREIKLLCHHCYVELRSKGTFTAAQK